VASLSQGRTAAAQCGLFTYKSVPVIFEPPCTTLPPVDGIVKCNNLLRQIPVNIDFNIIQCLISQLSP